MPLVVTQVARVTPRFIKVKGKFIEKFDVWPVRAPGSGWSPVYETFNPWHASLCKRAGELGKEVTLALRETQFGFEIVSVAMAEQEQAS